MLQERDSRPAGEGGDTSAAVGPDDTGEASGPRDGGNGSDPGDGGGPGGGDGGDGPGDGGGPGGGDGSGGPGFSDGPDGSSPGRLLARDAGPRLAALVNITIPWSAWTGPSGTPADVAGFGLADAADARDVAAAAARDPRTRWCVTVLHPDGTAAAHGCAHGRHPPPPGPGPGPDPPLGTGPPDPRDWIGRLRIKMTPIACGSCGHVHAEPGYRPSRALQHLVKVRNARCTAPGCGRAGARCDLDHTIAWDQGGLT